MHPNRFQRRESLYVLVQAQTRSPFLFLLSSHYDWTMTHVIHAYSLEEEEERKWGVKSIELDTTRMTERESEKSIVILCFVTQRIPLLIRTFTSSIEWDLFIVVTTTDNCSRWWQRERNSSFPAARCHPRKDSERKNERERETLNLDEWCSTGRLPSLAFDFQ